MKHPVYYQKLDSFTYIFASDSIGICLLLFMQLRFKVQPSDDASAKTEFYMK